MTFSISTGQASGCLTRALIDSAVALLLVLLPDLSTLPSAAAPPAAPSAERPPMKFGSQEEWRSFISHTPLPKTGCFKSSYPSTEWQEAPCIAAPPHKSHSARAFTPYIVGGDSNDFAAAVTGTISRATGSFPLVTGVSSEYTVNQQFANLWSLQLNAKPFNAATPCNAAPNPNCKGEQQFIFVNAGCPIQSSYTACIFIEYVLLEYSGPAYGNSNCPTGWVAAPGVVEVDCYMQGTVAAGFPLQNISNLGELVMTAEAGGIDTLMISTPSEMAAFGGNSLLGLQGNWQAAEFNVFGDVGGSEANFNPESTIVVRTEVDNGTSAAPSPLTVSYTGETNNLSLMPPACPISGATPGVTPAILFAESNAVGPKSPCACPVGTSWNQDQAACTCNQAGNVLVNGRCVISKCPAGAGLVFDAGGVSCRPIPKCPVDCRAGCIVDNMIPGSTRFICRQATR
jgi:hypothetical protein